jgi:hypothetical protein
LSLFSSSHIITISNLHLSAGSVKNEFEEGTLHGLLLGTPLPPPVRVSEDIEKVADGGR